MSYRLFASFVLATTALSIPAAAHADRRSFLETYEYMTMPEGDVELEFWNRQSRATFDPDSPREMQFEIELEYGITAHWDVALYQVFSQATNAGDPTMGSPFGYAGTKLETRYRLGERGENPVDTVLYFEIEKEHVADEDEWEFEPKVIVARDFGKVTTAFNAILEAKVARELEPDGEAEVETAFEAGWAFGVTYEVAPSFKVGAETFGSTHLTGEDETKALAGPSLSWAPSSKLWIATTAAFGLTDDSPDFQFGFVTGVGL